MKIEDIYNPKYREIAQYIEDNDIDNFYLLNKICMVNGYDEWLKILVSDRGCRFFSKWCFYKMLNKKRKKK